MSQKQDYYAFFGLTRDATERDIKRAFAKLAALNAPDRQTTEAAKNQAVEKMAFANEARDVLSDATLRRLYDAGGHAAVAKHKAQNAGNGGGAANTTPVYVPPPRSAEDTADAFRYGKSGDARASGFKPRGVTTRTFNVGGTKAAPQRPVPVQPARPVPAQPAQPQTQAQTPAQTTPEFVDQAQRKLQESVDAGVVLPAAELQAFRNSLENLMKTVDRALAMAQKNGQDNNFKP